MKENNQLITHYTVNGAEINSLILRLQKEDSRNLKTFKNFQWIFLVFIIIYGFIFIVNPFLDRGLLDRITGICYILGFIIFGWVFRKYYREYKTIDYSLPVAEMLQKAANRYKLRNRKTLIIIIPVLLIDAGITISIFQRYTAFTPWERIGLVQIMYIPTLIISFLIGVWIWYKKQKPLRDEALKLLDELRN
jgi:hypothetical protein